MSTYPHARFLKSAEAASGFADDSGAEVAFAGRSNSGKSSAINAILGRRDLARTSRTPGYGFARVPAAVREDWRRLMDAYFRRRESLAGLVIVVDARRGFGASDESMLRYAEARACPVHVLLTKADKLGRNESRSVLDATRAQLGGRSRSQLFSAANGTGVDAARGSVESLLARRG